MNRAKQFFASLVLTDVNAIAEQSGRLDRSGLDDIVRAELAKDLKDLRRYSRSAGFYLPMVRSYLQRRWGEV